MMLWDFIDNSNDYYKSNITDKPYRSHCNVIFRIQGGNEGLEEIFISEAKKAGIIQIKAHYYNPGVRISLYNAMPIEGVSYLLNFMRLFMNRYQNINYTPPKL
jgi:phosphoserine aminotransferase